MPELPTGTVTLLFSDIEGSTRLLKALGDEYGNVLAEHQRLLRAAFDGAGGHEIDTQGDAFFVAFARAKDAVAAALAAQRSLASNDWPYGQGGTGPNRHPHRRAGRRRGALRRPRRPSGGPYLFGRPRRSDSSLGRDP